MSRYIEYEPLMAELEREVELADDWKTAHEIANVVKYAPSIDIVRCGECKNHKPSKIWAEIKPCIVKPFPSMRCKMLNREVNTDDFCSYGEREGE